MFQIDTKVSLLRTILVKSGETSRCHRACICLVAWAWIRRSQAAIELSLEDDARRSQVQGAPAE